MAKGVWLRGCSGCACAASASGSASRARSHSVSWSSAPDTARVEDSCGDHSMEVMACHVCADVCADGHGWTWVDMGGLGRQAGERAGRRGRYVEMVGHRICIQLEHLGSGPPADASGRARRAFGWSACASPRYGRSLAGNVRRVRRVSRVRRVRRVRRASGVGGGGTVSAVTLVRVVSRVSRCGEQCGEKSERSVSRRYPQAYPQCLPAGLSPGLSPGLSSGRTVVGASGDQVVDHPVPRHDVDVLAMRL